MPSASCLGYTGVLTRLSHTLATLDCIASLALAATGAATPYTRPLVTAGGALRLEQCRHPCVEAAEGVSYIPNDCSIGGDGGELVLVSEYAHKYKHFIWKTCKC